MPFFIIHFLLIILTSLLPMTVYAWSPAQCYYGPNQKFLFDDTVESYQPCGDINDGIQSCCRTGHLCLEYSVCYGYDSGVTYTAGCTDPDYKDAVCPKKCNIPDLYWIGHNFCNTTDPPSWDCCLNTFGNADNGLKKPEAEFKKPCECPLTNPLIAFVAPNPIPNIGKIEYTAGLSLSYMPGAEPTGSKSTVSSALSSPTSTTTASSTAVGPTTPNPSAANPTTSPPPAALPYTPLPTSSIVGISIGAGLGSILLLGLLSFCLMRRRRAKKPGLQPLDLAAITSPKSPSFSFGNTLRRSRLYPQPTTPAMTEMLSPTFSSHKSELPADSPPAPTAYTATNEERPNTATTSTNGSHGLGIGAAISQQHSNPNTHFPYPNSTAPGPGPGPGSVVSEATNNTHTDPAGTISRAGSAATSGSAEAANTNANGNANTHGPPPPPPAPAAARVYMPYHPGLVGTSAAVQARLEGIHEMPG